MFARVSAPARPRTTPRASRRALSTRCAPRTPSAPRADLKPRPRQENDCFQIAATSTRALAPPAQFTPAQVFAFKCGLVLGLPLALYKIALDVRAQNIAERRRAAALGAKTRAASALDGRRDGMLRADAVAAKREARSEMRRRTNVMDIPVASNKKREVVMPTRATAKPATKPTAAVESKATARAPKAKGPPVKITLATQCALPDGVGLAVVGDDSAIERPIAMQRVGADRYQIVLEVGSGNLTYMYVAKKGDKLIKENRVKEGKGERTRQIDLDGKPLVIETEAPVF
jgi:hypothetical protein